MNQKPAKRGLSLLLSLAMIISMALVPGVVAYAADLTLTFDQASYAVTQSDTDQEVQVTLKATEAFPCCTTTGTVSVGSGLEIMDLLREDGATMGDEYNSATGQFTHFPDPVGMEDQMLTDIITIVVKVPANTPAGTYNVQVLDLQLGYEYAAEVHNAPSSMSTTIVVNDSSVTPDADYELYYTLDSTTDADTDKYMEYAADATVTATIYAKAAVATKLQAFDLYVTNDANLTYTSYTSAYGTLIASGTGASTATSQHIQAIGASKTNPINVDLPAGEEVAIATITFTVGSDAVYDTQMPITITDASNLAVENSPASVNTGNASYPLTIGSDVLGAEINTKHTVSFDSDGGTEYAAQTVGHNLTASNPGTPSKTGYTFDGWYSDSSKTTAFDFSTKITEDKTVYAKWTANQFEIIFKNEDGTELQKGNWDYGTTPTYSGTTPTKAADAQYTYTFAGWTPDIVPVTAAATYTATFTPTTNKYSVTFVDEDGTTILKAATEYDYGTAAADIAQPTTPTKAADATYTYAFAGWSPALAEVTADATYKATYTPTYIDYTITYAKGDHAADSYTAPEAKADAHNGDTITLPAAATPADGYTFTGWSDGTNTYDAGGSYTVSGTTTLTAVYSENHYNVVYDANEGTGTVPVSHNNVAYTETITISSGDSLSRTGYTFTGWNTKADGTGTGYSADATASKLSATDGDTVTLYAQWSTAAYTIAYDYDGGTVATDNVTSYDVEDLPITLTRPTKTGYTFDSWTIAVKSGESGNVTADGDTIKAGTYGNLTVKANWTPAEVNYTVEHYQQNIDNDEYTIVSADTETKTGTTGEQTAAAAKTYTGFTAKTVTQETIAADGSTVVKVYYDRNLHSVTYSYTGTVPTGAPAVPATIENVKYGATVTLTAVAPTLVHYDFSGWSKTGSFTMEDDDVSITGSWTEHGYTIKFWNLEEGESGNSVLYEKAYTESTQSDISVPTVPTKDWYDANGWTAYTLFSADEINVYPQYTKHTYKITFQDENGNDLADQGTDPNFDVDDKTITPPAVPDKPGYTGSWPTFPTDTPADATVQPVYTAVSYTIKFETDGGTAIADMTYTIKSTDPLPSATGKTFYTFKNWKVTTADGNWEADSAINGGTEVTGKYGNVTLTAQWDESLSYALEEYKYAPTGYKLLIIDAAGLSDGSVYTYDGDTMYYTEDANYKVGESTAVYYTLVKVSDFGIDKISSTTGTAQTITYDGDINGDGKVNIADANAVFQMVVDSGSYYSLDQLSIAQRLAADMVTATDNAEHRGSIEDVNAIVAIINGTN